MKRLIASYRSKLAGKDALRNTHPANQIKDAQLPLVSVVIPVYNTERFVEICIRSVMAQTLPQIEIICVDDASPDRSRLIIKRLAQRDKRIRLVIHGQNIGIGGARNTGIAAARAAFVMGIDSDDYIRPDMIERLWEASGAGRADVVACGMAVLKDDGSLLYNVSWPRKKYVNDENQIDIINVLNPSFCNKLWRKALFATHGIRFPENQYYEDLATTPRVLRFANDIRVIPDPLYCYVQREDSITNSTSSKHILDYLRTFDILTDFLEEEGLTNRYRDEMVSMIGRTLNYHGRSVIASQLKPEERAQYLKYMLMLKFAYLEYNEQFRSLKEDLIHDLLLTANSLADVESFPDPC